MAYIHWSTIKVILKLDPQNQKVIDFLITCIQDDQYDYSQRREAKERLSKIQQANDYTTGKLVDLILHYREPYNHIAFNTIEILAEIVPRNVHALELLETWIKQEINPTLYGNRYLDSIKLLGSKIDPKNVLAIKHLEDLIKTCQENEDKRLLIEDNLVEIDPENPLILEYYLKKIEEQGFYNEENHREGIYGGQLHDWLKNVNSNYSRNQEIIAIIIQWMLCLKAKDYDWVEEICQWLAKVEYSNIQQLRDDLIDALIYLLNTLEEPQYGYGNAQYPIIECLGAIARGNLRAIEFLVSWIKKVDNYYREKAVTALGNIALGSDTAFDAILFYCEEERNLFEEEVDNVCQALAKISVQKSRIINTFIFWIEEPFKNIYNPEVVTEVVIKWLGIVGYKNEDAINCILSWIEQNNAHLGYNLCKWDIVIEALANIDSENELVINALASLIQNIAPDDAEYWLSTYDDEEQQKLNTAIYFLTKIGIGKPQIINAIANLISNISNISFSDINVYKKGISLLLKIDINQKQTREVLFNSLTNTDIYNHDLKETAVNYLFMLLKFNYKKINKYKKNYDFLEDKLSLLTPINYIINNLASLLKNYDFLEDIFQNYHHPDVIIKIIKGLDKNAFNNFIVIDAICSLMNNREMYENNISNYNIDQNIFNYLGKSQLGKIRAIDTLTSIITNTETDYYIYEKAIHWLIMTAPAEEKVIDLLLYLTQPNSEIEESTKEDLTALWFKNVPQYKVIAVKNLEQRLKVLENNFQTIESALLLWQIAPNNDRALDAILFLLNHPDTNDKTLARLIEILDIFQKLNILNKTILPQQLQKIVAITSQLLNNISSDNYDDLDIYYYRVKTYKQILWYCTKNLSYPNFYLGWYNIQH